MNEVNNQWAHVKQINTPRAPPPALVMRDFGLEARFPREDKLVMDKPG